MRKIIVRIMILLLSLILLFLFAISVWIFNPNNWFDSPDQRERKILNANSKNVWVNSEDKFLAQKIETEILNRYHKPKKDKLILTVPNIKNICYVQSIYSSTEDVLKELEIKNRFAKTIDYKKEYLSYGGDNSSVIILVKNNKQLIPIFTNADFVKTTFNFLQKQKFGCYYIKNDSVKITIYNDGKDVCLVFD